MPSTPRLVLAAALAEALPADVYVEPYARDGLTLTKPTVMLRIDDVGRSLAAPGAERVYTYALIVAVPQQTVHGPADDRLDALLEDTLYAIEQAPGLPQWTAARRAVYGDEYPAYEVTIPVRYTITA